MMKKFLLVLFMIALAGCSNVKKTFLSTGPSASPASCETNPYLKAYHCSIEAVQVNASRGNPDAQYALGYMYYYGIGTSRNTDLALVWIKKAAAQKQDLAVKALPMMQPAANSTSPVVGDAATQAKPTVGRAAVAVPPAVQSPGVAKSGAVSSQAVMALPSGNGTATAKLTGYTLQVMMSHNLTKLSDVSLPHLSAGQTVQILENNNGQTTNYLLTIGQFTTKQAARQALERLPLGLRNMSPWVRPLQGLKLAPVHGV
jgi:TPR repeat protein